MAPLPLLKLGALLLKTLAKPVANRIKIEVRKHPRFSVLCANMGEYSHQITSRLNVMASGYKILKVEPLPPEEALARGINIVSESFIFGVAGGLLVFEYQRGELKAAAKAQQQADAEKMYRDYLDGKFMHVYKEIKDLNHRLQAIEQSLEEQEAARQRWFSSSSKSSAKTDPSMKNQDTPPSFETSNNDKPHTDDEILDEPDDVNTDITANASEISKAKPSSSTWWWSWWQ